MGTNLILCCKNLLKSNSYDGNNHFHSAFSWQSQNVGHILINNATNENTVLAIVSQVLEKGLQCSSSGNYHGCNYETLEKAKFQLFLGKPTKTGFTNNFNATIQKLVTLQAYIVLYPLCKNLIVLNGHEKMFWFTCNMFKEEITHTMVTSIVMKVVMTQLVGFCRGCNEYHHRRMANPVGISYSVGQHQR